LSGSEPIVSIITPTFNHERYIRRCLESAITQTDQRWEQIVVDDGSDDGTEAIIRSIPDPRIRYVRRSHRGIMHLAESYNVALGMSRGDFVAVLEGDDFWPVDKIERQLRLFDRPEIVLAWGLAAVTNEIGEVQRTFPDAAIVARMQVATRGETVRSLLKENFIPACTVMLRRDALAGIGGFQQPDTVPTADFPTWLELCRTGPFASANEVLGFHRQHENQATVQMKPEMDFVLDFGTRFIEQLQDGERDALGVSIDEAHHIRRNRHAHLDYEAGRSTLRINQGSMARALFRRALRNGSTTTRLKASFSLACSYLGLDLDRAAAVANRVLGR
jgi:glycosyltransferase involved in cell wall biosynthesis